MKSIVKAIWTGRLFYVAAILAWTLPLWLVHTRLDHGTAEAVALGALATYFLSMYGRSIAEDSIIQSLTKAGAFSSIGSLTGLVVFVSLRPYHSSGISWLVAVICGIVASLVIYGLISWFETETIGAKASARKREKGDEDKVGEIAFSALIWDWLMSLALPIFLFISIVTK